MMHNRGYTWELQVQQMELIPIVGFGPYVGHEGWMFIKFRKGRNQRLVTIEYGLHHEGTT